MTIQPNTTAFREAIQALPAEPSPNVSEKYSFIDTRTVVDNMLDLGFDIYSFDRPKFRTNDGAYGLHMVDFRHPEDTDNGSGEQPRILFLNTYDGSRRAQFISGIFRLVCLNGLISGTTMTNEKFLHMNLDEEEFLEQVRETGAKANQAFGQIREYKNMELSPAAYDEMAKQALKLRFPNDDDLSVDPAVSMMPRREADVKSDLWTTWNRLQENLMRGGVPGVNANGDVRTARPVNQLLKTVQLNQGLWDLLENTAEDAQLQAA